MRKVFLDELPKWNSGSYKGKVNWKECIGRKIKFVYDDVEGWVEIVDYDGKCLYIKYKKQKPIKMYLGDFIYCRMAKILGKRTVEFKFEIGTTFKDDKRDIIIIDREYRDNPYNKGKQLKWYKYKCNKCNYEDYKVESDLNNGNGCACCCSPSQIVVEGVSDIPTTASWMVKFFQGGYDEAKLYTRSSSKKIYPICPDCGRVRDKAVSISFIYQTKSIGCPYCGDGIKYPNKFVFNVLKYLGIDFETEYSSDWIKPKKYDFYFEINKDKYIIEAHGEQHYRQTNRGRTHDEEVENDRIKKESALKNKIKEENYIVIDCRKSELEWIRDNILNSRLNDLFDLSIIDWNKCEEFALSNRVKEACELKRNNPNLTANKIGEIMKLHQTTIIRYLKRGSKIWDWINYNPKEEQLKAVSKCGKNAQQVEMFKDYISLGVFESCSDLEKKSEKLFGIKLNYKEISAVCNGKRPHYKGFTFKYA